MGAFWGWGQGGGLEEGIVEPEQNGKEILREGQPGVGYWSLTKSGGVCAAGWWPGGAGNKSTKSIRMRSTEEAEVAPRPRSVGAEAC